MPDLMPEDYAELKTDIANRGVQVAIEYDEDGNVLDGHHRLKICSELGIADWPKVVRVGMTEAQKREHARKLNMARRQLNREQRQELIRQQLQETPEKSDRQIAQRLGVSDKTVGVQRKEMERTAEIPQLKTNIGADGKERPRQIDHKPITIFNPTKSKIDVAKELVKNASPELVQAVAGNKVPLMQAHAVASAATKEQQTEALKRLEDGKVPYLMEGLNQQKFENFLNVTPEQRQESEQRIRDSDKKIDNEFKLSKQIDKTVFTILEIQPSEIDEAVQYWLEHARSVDERDDIIIDITNCIERLQMLKAAFSKTKTLKVVK
jgi:ParB-like chromosome segregation protein Spo0J